MADVNIVGKISVDPGNSTKSISDLKKEINDSKKAMDNASIGSKEYKAAQENLKKSTGELSNATGKQTGALGGLKQGLAGLAPGLNGAATGAAGLGKQLWLLVANPIGAVIAVIVGAFALLFTVLKKFDPVMDALEQGFNAVKAVFDVLLEGVLALVTGAKSLGNVFSGLGKSIKGAAAEAIAYTKIQQDLEDLITKSVVNQSKYNKQINELLLLSKDRTKTEAERVALIDGALSVENKAYLERKNIADKELKAARLKLIAGKDFTKEQAIQLKEQGVDYAIFLKDSKRLNQADIDNLAQKLANKENLENESIGTREKALNRKYVLEDSAIEKQNTLEEKSAAASKKRSEEKVANELTALEKIKAANELYFKSVIDKGTKSEFDQKAIQELGLGFDQFFAAEEEKIRQEGVNAEVERGKTLQTQFEEKKANSEKLTLIEKLALQAKIELLSATANVLGTFSDMLGKQTAAGKTLAIAQASINAYLGISEVWRAKNIYPEPFGTGIKIASTVAVAASAFANVKKIIAVQVPGGGGGGSAPSLSTSTAPLAPTPMQTNTTLDAKSIQGVGQASQGGTSRTFVLDSDIKNSQERQARIQRAARI